MQKFGYESYERGHHGWTPLHSTAYGGHLHVLHYLIDNKCDPNISDDDNVTLLHVSSYKGHIDIIAYLIDTCNVLVDAVDCYNTTAVMYATLGGQDKAVNLLISKYQCDTSVCSSGGHSLSLLTCHSSQKKLIDTLESLQLFNPQSVDSIGRGVIHYTCAGGSVEILEYLIQHYDLELTVQDNEGKTGLHIAAMYSSTSIVKYIVKRLGIHTILEGDSTTCNPLYYACCGSLQSYSTKIFKKLLSSIGIKSITSVPTGPYFDHMAINMSPIKVSERISLVSWMLEQCSTLPHFNINATYCNGEALVHAACTSGSISLVKILEQYNANINMLDNDGGTALHSTALAGSLTLFKYLVKHHQLDPYCKSNEGTTPLHLAGISGNVNMVEYLAGISDVNYQDHYGQNVLHKACTNGHTDVVEYLIVDKGMVTSVMDNEDCTLLHHAAMSDNLSLVKLLVDQYQLNPYQGDTKGRLPVHAATQKGHTTIVRYFIVEKAMDANVIDNEGSTLLHHAAMSDNVSLVKLLVYQYQLNPYQVNIQGYLPVHIAAQKNRTTIVRYFIVEKAMDANVTDNSGLTLLHHVALTMSDNLSLVKLLVDQYQLNPYQGDTQGCLPVHFAAQRGCTTIVRYFIVEKAMDANVTDNEGLTLLHHAAMSNNVSLVKLLVDQYQLNPYQGDTKGRLPIHVAAQHGHTTIVRYFIVEKAMDANVTDNEGLTLLHHAAMSNNVSLVKLLVDQYQLNPYQGDTKGRLPIHVAAQHGHTTIVRYFIVEKAMDANVTNNESLTLLHHAAMSDNISLVKLLVDQYQLNPYQVNLQGRLPIHIAARYGCTTIVKYFINQCHVHVAIRTVNGYNVVHYATVNGHYNTTEYLSTVYIDGFSVPSNNGVLPIHTACESGNIQLVEYLVDVIGCDIRSLTNSHQSCAVFACMSGNLDLLKLLSFKYSLDLTVTDRDGFTLLHYAAEKGHNHIIEWLVEEHQLDPHSTSSNSTTTLHKAASGGVADTVKYLYEAYSLDVNSTTTINKYTPLHSATVMGHLPVVQYLTELPQCNVAAKDSDGSTVLHLSSKHGFVNLLEHYLGGHNTLLEANNLYNSKDLSPLDFGCIYGNLPVVKYLVENPKLNQNMNKKEAFHCALDGEHIDIMYYLFNKVTSATLIPSYIAIKGVNGNTPCHVACSSGNLDIVKSFVDATLSSNPLLLAHANDDGYNIFHFASISRSLLVVKYLVNIINLLSGIGIYVKNLLQSKTKEGYTPLHLSCVNGHIEVFKSLATLCPSTISMVDNKGRGLMHAAAQSTNVGLIDLLADEYILKSDTPDNTGVTTLHIAAEIGNLIAFKALINHTGKSGNYNPVSDNGKTPFSIACENGYNLITSYLVEDLKVSPNVSSTTSTSYTPLHLAAANNKVGTVQLLVEKYSVDVNCTVYGFTPIHLATIKGHIAVVTYLTRLPQCNVTAALTDGSTVLHLSSKHGHYHLVNHFVKNHKQLLTSVCLCDKKNLTPLHYACRGGYLSIVKCLVEQGNSDTTIQDNDGCTCYHHTVIRDCIDIMKYLVSLDNSMVSISIVDNSSNTPLHIACSSDSLEMVQVLVEAITDEKPSLFTITNSDGYNAIHCAAKKGNIPIMGFIAVCCKSKNMVHLFESCNSVGQTPLHVACLHRHNTLVKSLATLCPSTISMVDNNGRGLMHAAAQTANIDMVKYLGEKHNLSSDTPDRWGMRPTHMLQFIAATQRFLQTL